VGAAERPLRVRAPAGGAAPSAAPALPAWAEGAVVRAGSVAAALLVGAALLAATEHDPWTAYREMAVGAFGSAYAWEQTLVKAIPLALTGLGVALAFTMGLWNIGAEGQLLMGALAASWLALAGPALPPAAAVPVLGLLGAAGGALWALGPALLRAYVGVSEIISTLMLNYVAALWVDYLVFGAWADPAAFSFPYSRPFPEGMRFPLLVGEIHLGALLALGLAALLAWGLRRTRWGFEVRAIGAGAEAAHAAGVAVRRYVLAVMAVSGALAGLAGVGEVAGVVHRLQQGLSPGYGFSAIIVAWMAGLHPWAVVAVAVLFAGLLNGGFVIQTAGVPAAIAAMLQALILFFVLAGEVAVRRRRRHRLLASSAAGGA